MATPADDVSCRSFVYPEFLAAQGPITAQNAMDYFQTSIFWDTSSNNATLRMQTMHTGLPVPDEEGQLKKFTGIEFWLVHAQPNLFIIHKRERLSPTEVKVLAAYFIMNDVIYCAPDIYSVISGRLRSSLHNLRASLDLLREHRPEFTPRKGHLWTVEMATTNPLLQPKDDAKKNQASTDAGPSSDGMDVSTSQYEKGSERKSGEKSTDTKLSTSNKRTEFRPLLRAMETTRRYVEQRTANSRMDIYPSNAGTVPATPGMIADGTNAGATPQLGSSAQTFTMAGSSQGFTPAVGGGTGTDIRRSTSIGVAGSSTPGPGAASPDTPGAGIPGVPGAGKKKRKRQANVANKKAAASASPEAEGLGAVSPSVASPMSGLK
ncbi:Mediator of RNA polymerase II transcription subunit 6 [Tulasnella sp. 418]|nr:Mediator of RNA polymerase II transcription subunit 6 [Tulasnella sp. 418]